MTSFAPGILDVFSLLLLLFIIVFILLLSIWIRNSLYIHISKGFNQRFEKEKGEIKTKSSRVNNENEEPQAIGSIPLFVKLILDEFKKMSPDHTLSIAVPFVVSGIIDRFGEIKSKLSNSSLVSKDIKPDQTLALAPQLRLTEETTYPLQNRTTYINETKPKMKLTYQVLNEGQGETMTIYRQGYFQYKEADSVEAISFEGSPTVMANILGPGFEEAMLEAIVGMKSNGRRIIFIPIEVSGLEENTFLELKLISIRDHNLRSRI